MATRTLANVATTDLQRELARRERQVDSLLGKRERLQAQIDDIDSELSALSVSAGGGTSARGTGRGRSRKKGVHKKRTTRKRPKNDMNLVEALQKTLKNKELGVQDIVDAVQKQGYKTSSPNFRTIVNQTLIINKKQFKRVARGIYTAK
jgi:predicted RNase H-like nuclease